MRAYTTSLQHPVPDIVHRKRGGFLPYRLADSTEKIKYIMYSSEMMEYLAGSRSEKAAARAPGKAMSSTAVQ